MKTENGKQILRVATNFFSVPKMFSVMPIFLTCIFGTTNFLVRKSGVQKFFSLCLKLNGKILACPISRAKKSNQNIRRAWNWKRWNYFWRQRQIFFILPKMFSGTPIFLTCIFGTTNFWNVFLSGNRVQNYARIFGAQKKLGAPENLARKINRVTVL